MRKNRPGVRDGYEVSGRYGEKAIVDERLLIDRTSWKLLRRGKSAPELVVGRINKTRVARPMVAGYYFGETIAAGKRFSNDAGSSVYIYIYIYV